VWRINGARLMEGYPTPVIPCAEMLAWLRQYVRDENTHMVEKLICTRNPPSK
jgi:hypothetical protein